MKRRDNTAKGADYTKAKYRHRELLGVLLIACAFFMMAVYLGLSTGSFGSFLNKVLSYTLGLGALFAPLVFFVIGGGLLFYHRNFVLTWGFAALVLFMICVLGLLHHLMVPIGEELFPEQLPQGGGLVGGLLLSGLRTVLGSIGALVALAAGLVISIVLTGKISFHSALSKAGTSFKKVTSRSIFSHDYEEDEDEYEDADADGDTGDDSYQGGQLEAQSPRSVPENVYKQSEFSDYTQDIQKPSLFKNILHWGRSDNKTTTTVLDAPDFSSQLGTTSDSELDPTVNDKGQRPSLSPVYPEKPNVVVLRPRSLQDPADGEGKNNSTAGTEEMEAATSEVQKTVSDPESDTHQTLSIDNFSDTDHKNTISAPEPPAQKIITSNAETSVGSNTGTEEKLAPTSYKLPPLEILNQPVRMRREDYEADIRKQCSILEQTLADFKVRAEVVHVTRGPSVTRFELEPAPGVKVSSIVNLADDIALRLAASGVRIEAPIPGKAAIGIEAPNTKTDPVSFREVVDCPELKAEHHKLCVGLGRDISGKVITADLAKMPHLLVAGSTGSGKSVCINTIIAGILYRARPDEVKFILVDPKVVELTNYNGIPHLLVPVVTDAKKAASALHWAVSEMEKRYQSFADCHVRDIDSYNKQAAEKMPYIVIIIDELSDLMMVAKVDVEDAILRLAQKARAAGIHLVIATQRPSVDVITGIVKANIPSRIAFAVSSQIDSRTILDETGAEKLLGKGDMLFYPIGKNKPLRVQGAFVTDGELNRIVSFIKEQALPVVYADEVTQQALAADKESHNGSSQDDLTGDLLFKDALTLVLDVGQASSSMLQRRFRIGYTRAARLVDCMEQLGIVGPAVGSKPRQLIMSRADIEAAFLNKE